MIKKEMLALLACTNCKGPLHYDKDKRHLDCGKCRLRFKVLDDDIPDMLIEDADKY
jgi:uncharacterized protein YbaR (Trm112 family)